MTWTEERDVLFCREIVVVEPFKHKEKSRERGQAWQDLADHLNEFPGFTVSARAVRERFKLLQMNFKKKERQEHAASGISPDISELDILLEEILLRIKECQLEFVRQDTENKEQESGKAEDIRNEAMETLAETKKRKTAEGISPTLSKKRRSSGSETVQFLREKMENDNNLKEQELELKKTEQKQQADMLAHMQTMQMNFMQQQQAQTQALVGLLGKLLQK